MREKPAKKVCEHQRPVTEIMPVRAETFEPCITCVCPRCDDRAGGVDDVLTSLSPSTQMPRCTRSLFGMRLFTLQTKAW